MKKRAKVQASTLRLNEWDVFELVETRTTGEPVPFPYWTWRKTFVKKEKAQQFARQIRAGK